MLLGDRNWTDQSLTITMPRSTIELFFQGMNERSESPMVINTTVTDDRLCGFDLSYWEMKEKKKKEYPFMT